MKDAHACRRTHRGSAVHVLFFFFVLFWKRDPGELWRAVMVLVVVIVSVRPEAAAAAHRASLWKHHPLTLLRCGGTLQKLDHWQQRRQNKQTGGDSSSCQWSGCWQPTRQIQSVLIWVNETCWCTGFNDINAVQAEKFIFRCGLFKAFNFQNRGYWLQL